MRSVNSYEQNCMQKLRPKKVDSKVEQNRPSSALNYIFLKILVYDKNKMLRTAFNQTCSLPFSCIDKTFLKTHFLRTNVLNLQTFLLLFVK